MLATKQPTYKLRLFEKLIEQSINSNVYERNNNHIRAIGSY